VRKITLIEAYKKVKEIPNNNILISCLDFGDFWGFMFCEKPLPAYSFFPVTDRNTGKQIMTPDFYAGCCYDTVDKQSGEISDFNPIQDLDLHSSATPIDIEQFNDK